MQLNFSVRGNGACPLCKRLKGCNILANLKSSVRDVKDAKMEGMELVVYTCPQFVEKA
jgi:hypothetical protein